MNIYLTKSAFTDRSPERTATPRRVIALLFLVAAVPELSAVFAHINEPIVLIVSAPGILLVLGYLIQLFAPHFAPKIIWWSSLAYNLPIFGLLLLIAVLANSTIGSAALLFALPSGIGTFLSYIALDSMKDPS